MGTWVLGLVGLWWGAMGLATLLFPERVMEGIRASLGNPWRRFWMTQTLLVSGLILIVGTLMLEGVWLWVGCGVLMVFKAGYLLSSSEQSRSHCIRYLAGWPRWLLRLGGILNLGLSVVLGGDLILHG